MNRGIVAGRQSAASWIVMTVAVIFSAPCAAAQTTDEDARAAEQAARRRAENDERTRRLVTQFAVLTRETKSMLDTLAAKHAASTRRLDELMSSDDGKRVGLEPAAILSIVRVLDEPLVRTEDLSQRKLAIASLLTGVEGELKRDSIGYVPEGQTKREVDELYFWTRDRLSRLTEHEAWLDALIAKVPKERELSGLATLEERIRVFRAEVRRAAEEAALLGAQKGREEAREKISDAARIAALEKANEEAERMVREARAEATRMKLEFELRLKQAEEEQARRATEAEIRYKDAMAELERAKKAADAQRTAADVENTVQTNQTLAEAEQKRLRARCEDPDVLRALAPFVSPGYWQPTGKGIDKKPMSWKALNDSGGLGLDEAGLVKLWWIGSNRNNDRPHFSKEQPANAPVKMVLKNLSDEQLEEIKKARDLLRELGPTLVGCQKLAP